VFPSPTNVLHKCVYIYINIKLTSITYVSCTTSGFSIATSNIAGATFCAFCATSAHSVALGHWQSPLLSACLNFAIVGHMAETWPRERCQTITRKKWNFKDQVRPTKQKNPQTAGVLKGFPHKHVILDQNWRYDQITFEHAHMAFLSTFHSFKSSSTISVQKKNLAH
jgi:hypothetical protein